VTLELLVAESPDLDAAARRDLEGLWRRAFGDRFTEDDANHAFGGVHVVGYLAGRVVAHASAVPRSIRFADGPWQTIGYVEAVAVDPDVQGQGIGRQLMQSLQREIDARWPVAMLSTGRATRFYERLGWKQWGGISCTRTTSGIVADDEHGGLMIRPFPSSVAPDLTAAVTCEDRSGDAW